jgi:hypothetical protein
MNSNRASRVASAFAGNGGPRRRLEAWLLPLAPALLGGFHLAGLLLFLNPRLPLAFGTLARAALVYAALLAPPSILVHLALARASRRPVRRILPWTLTAVALAGALGDWVHASYFSFYLPAGINNQLIKTALWLTGGALLVFYTALLHSIHRRRYGPRSQLFLVLVALGTVYAMFDRRTNFRPPPATLAGPVAAAGERAPHLAVVALPSATLDALLPLAEQGKLPFFQGLIESGARARLATLAPNRPLALWATLATGKLPPRHGLEAERLWEVSWLPGAPLRLLPLAVGFEHWGLPGGEPRSARRADREARPLWTTLAALGRTSAAPGFPAVLDGAADGAALEPAAASPAERELAALGYGDLARALGADRARLGAARRRLADEPELAALFLRLDGLESASLACFGGFAAAEFEGERAGRVRRAADALATYYGGLDGELAELWAALPEPRLLVVVSPWGVRAPAGVGRILLALSNRPRLRGRLAGAPDGLFLARGEGIRPGVQVPAAELADVVPTLLYALGLPIARDLDGKVLAATFEPALLQRRSLTFVPSYEGLAAPAALSGP